jgi:hypothetical protein
VRPLLSAFLALQAAALQLQPVLDKPGSLGDAGTALFSAGDSGYDGPDGAFSGRVTLQATLTFTRFGDGPSFSFLQLGDGASPALAAGNGWHPRVWSVFHDGRDTPIPGNIPVRLGEARTISVQIDYRARKLDSATISLSGASEPLLVQGDFSFSRLLLRSGNSPEATTLSAEQITLDGLPKRFRSQAPPKIQPTILGHQKLQAYVERFNADDEELYANIPNKDAYAFLRDNIPLFECPDPDVERTYYFRWWTYRKHVKNTPDGTVITEFLPKVSWSGKHNTISCPAAHHYYEGRWLHNPAFLDDYSLFWLRRGGQPRLYSFWIADAFYKRHLVTPNPELLVDLLPDLVRNYEAWETGWKWGKHHIGQHENGLFYTIDDRDGGEVSIGGHGYRPTLNSFMYGDARAIAAIARMAGDAESATRFAAKAARLKELVQAKLWDPEAQFFKILPKDGAPLRDVRELYGYTPWYFELPDPGYEAGWRELMDPKGFKAPFGPTFAEQRHPGFKIAYSGHECQWNGPSWPLATCSVLTALANLLNKYEQDVIGKQDYFQTLMTYTRSHQLKREDGKVLPWIDENLNPYTGDWISRTRLKTWENGGWSPRKGGYERGKDYNHSTYNDLIITGLVGLRPRADEQIDVNPLLPPGSWASFCLDKVYYHGRVLTIVWDETGKVYGQGAGLSLFVDGKRVAHADDLQRLQASLRKAP